jgi:D-lactate dehydrogenase (cytochrome)
MAGRALATRLRAVLRDILAAEGAVQAQIGRYYAHAGHLAPGSESLLRRIKQALDPESRMNPGALGLEPPGAAQSNAGSPA